MIETDLIWYYKKIGKSYNTTLGGEGIKGVKFTDETREKLRKANLGKRLSEETRKRMGEGHSKKICQYSKDGVLLELYENIEGKGVKTDVIELVYTQDANVLFQP